MDVGMDRLPTVDVAGFRCGLEFKMPMRTAAVGWFLSVTTSD